MFQFNTIQEASGKSAIAFYSTHKIVVSVENRLLKNRIWERVGQICYTHKNVFQFNTNQEASGKSAIEFCSTHKIVVSVENRLLRNKKMFEKLLIQVS